MIKYEINDIKAIASALKKGDCIAFPTDTVFGLACVYDDEKAIQKIKDMKHRDQHKPLPMMCSNIQMIEEVAYISEEAYKIMEKYFPGALTIVFKKREELPAYITNGFNTIAIRIPNVKFIQDLIDEVGKPLLVTSANISNEPSLMYVEDVIYKLGDHLDGIVMEDAASSISSTIIDLSQNELKILRQGEITEAMLKEVLR